jgi:hypothetical protein
MITKHVFRHSILAACLCLIAASTIVYGQQDSATYKPEPYQEGKDVVWVPTEQALVDTMLNMAKLTPKDYLIDLGSGDGRTVITAAKRGARALGVEYNPELVALSKAAAAKEGVADRAQFIRGDLFETDISQATVITLFLLSDINLKLRPRILNLKPGTRIVSNTFDMGDWEPDNRASVREKECENGFCIAYFWLVPAQVKGTWELQAGELTLKQTYQMISGTLKSGGNTRTISKASLSGDRISFVAGDTEYVGRVNGNSMEGKFQSAKNSGKWSATRISE